jgi:hypothetical protein
MIYLVPQTMMPIIINFFFFFKLLVLTWLLDLEEKFKYLNFSLLFPLGSYFYIQTIQIGIWPNHKRAFCKQKHKTDLKKPDRIMLEYFAFWQHLFPSTRFENQAPFMQIPEQAKHTKIDTLHPLTKRKLQFINLSLSQFIIS